MDGIDKAQRLIATGVFQVITELITSDDLKNLKLLGLDNHSIGIFKEISVMEQSTICSALEAALNYQVDSDKFRAALLTQKKLNSDNGVLLKLIKAGGTYELCRNFYGGHTNRKHTQLRKQLGVNQNTIVFAKNEPDQKACYEYFYRTIQEQQKIQATDLLDYHQANKVSLSRLWRCLLNYLKESA